MKIISTSSAFSELMTENETKHFLTNSNNNLLMHIGTIDSKGEPNVTVTAFYFDERTERIYFTTLKSSEKVQHLNNKEVISFSIIDPNVTYKGAKTFSLAEAADALRYLVEGRPSGRVVLTIRQECIISV